MTRFLTGHAVPPQLVGIVRGAHGVWDPAGGGLLMTILIILGIIAVGAWIIFSGGIHQK